MESGGLVSIGRTSKGVFKPKTQHTPLEKLDHSLLLKVKIHLNVQNYKTWSALQCVYVLNQRWFYFCFTLLWQMHRDHTWTVPFHHFSRLWKKLIWTFQLQCSVKCRTKVARHFWLLWHGWFKTKIIVIIVSNNNSNNKMQRKEKIIKAITSSTGKRWFELCLWRERKTKEKKLGVDIVDCISSPVYCLSAL